MNQDEEHECGEACDEPGHHAFPGLATHDVLQGALDAAGAAPALPEAPAAIAELANACIRFVTAMLGKLSGTVNPDLAPDFTSETLSLIDHYVAESRRSLAERPEAIPLSTNTIGAHLGEVIRRQHRCWWRMGEGDAVTWCLDFEAVKLSFFPMQMAYGLLAAEEGSDHQFSGFELSDEDHDHVIARLAELPRVSEEEYRLPSLRLEVLDISIETLVAKQLNDPYAKRAFGPSDYP